MSSKVPLPSSILPRVRKSLELSTEEVSRLVESLVKIYTPRVLGSQILLDTAPSRLLSNSRDEVDIAEKKYNRNASSDGISTVIDAEMLSLRSKNYINVSSQDSAVPNLSALNGAVVNTGDGLNNPDMAASGLTSASQLDELADSQDTKQLETLLADDFERSFVFQWLTSLIAHSEEWISREVVEEITLEASSSTGLCSRQTREQVIERASALLAACSGTSSSGSLTRTFVFPLHPKSFTSAAAVYNTSVDINFASLMAPIQIHLKDDSVPSQDIEAVGLQTWGSAPVLAQLIADSPSKYGLDASLTAQRALDSFKVLEIGAGTGLISLFIWKFLERRALLSSGAARKYSVVATDFHPSVLSNMVVNFDLNKALISASSSNSVAPGQATIEAAFLDWAHPPCLDDAEKYDLIFGVDIVYEKGHAELVRNAVEASLRKPNPVENAGDCGGVFWLIYPLRPTHDYETKSIEHVFGSVAPSDLPAPNAGGLEKDGWALRVLYKEVLERRKGIGRADEIVYHILKVGWVPK